MANERLRRELVEGMLALKRIGVIDGATMRQFERKVLGAPPVYSAQRVRRIRERYHVSQPVFAALLNVSTSTLQKWEQGQKTPNAAACRLLQVVEEHGLGVLVPRDNRRAA